MKSLLVQGAGLGRRMWAAWNRFWFESDGRAQMALLRWGAGSVLLTAYVIRSLDLPLFFSNRGIAPLAVVPEVLDLTHRYSLFFVFTSEAALWAWNAVFLASLVGIIVGVAPRLCAFVALVLHISFLHRNLGAAYGVDMVGTFFLFALTLADPRAPESAPKKDFRAMLGSVAWRLAQIQLCIIYAYAGLHKLKGAHWWQGEAMWDTLANAQMARWDFSFFAQIPWLLILATWASLFWEVYFPVLVWIRPIRYAVLAFGVFFNLGIGVGLGIPFFGGLMITLFLLFVETRDALRIRSRVRKFIPILK